MGKPRYNVFRENEFQCEFVFQTSTCNIRRRRTRLRKVRAKCIAREIGMTPGNFRARIESNVVYPCMIVANFSGILEIDAVRGQNVRHFFLVSSKKLVTRHFRRCKVFPMIKAKKNFQIENKYSERNSKTSFLNLMINCTI